MWWMALCGQAGVKNGMFFGRARILCPNLTPIPYDFEAYRSVSQLLYDTVARSARKLPLFERVLCTLSFVGRLLVTVDNSWCS